jgi:predicted dehydrogenase
VGAVDTDPGSVGVIGLGEIGQVHDPDLVAAFEAQGVRGYREAGELIADAQVGTVCVCLPHHLHFPVALAAIRARRNVLVEKPLTTSLGEGQQLVDAAAGAGVALGVSHNQVFYTAHAEAKRLIEGGVIGRPVLIRLRLGEGPAFGGWRGSPDPVREVRALVDAPRERGETFAVVVLEFSSGARGIIEANDHGPPGTFDDEIEIVGTDATLRLAGLESLFVGYRSGPALSMFRDRQWQEVPVQPDDWAASVQASVTAYLDAVTAGREPPVTGATALETVRLLQRIYDTATVLPGQE